MADWVLIEDCEDAWTAGTVQMTASLDTTFEQVGSGCARVDVNAAAAADDVMMYEDISSTDLSGQRHLVFYARSSVALDAGDVQIGYDETSAMASAEEWLDLPAMLADTWYRHIVTFTTPSTSRNAVVCIAFRMHVDKGAFTFFADDVRAFCGYTLPEVTNHLGTFSIFVGSDIPDLTAPTVNTLTNIGTLRERLDLIPGNIDLATLDLSFVDDYSVHSEGFWGAVLEGSVDIKILLDEGAGDTFVFWGMVKKDETKFDELYVSGSTVKRIGTITLVSTLAKMRDVTFRSISEFLYGSTAYIEDGAAEYRYVRVADIFCAAIELAFQQEYASGDCYLTDEGGTDLAYQYSSSDYTFEDLYVDFMSYSVTWSYDGYFYWAGANPFSLYYGNPWELCKDLARQFGLVPHHVYDIATSRHKIELLQRGRALSAAVTLNAPVKSVMLPYNPLGTARVRVFRMLDETHQQWSHDGVTGEGVPNTELNFDTEIPCLFVLEGGGTVNLFERLFKFVGAPGVGGGEYIDGIEVYSYVDVATTLYNSGNYRFQHALLHYYVDRYPVRAQKTYNRTYHTIQGTVSGTTSHTKVSLMRENAIGGVNYGISEYEKNFDTGELKLTLVDI